MFNLPLIGVFAQENPAPDEAIVIELGPAADPIRTAEQAISLGEDAAGAQTVPAASALSILRVLLTLAVVAAAIYGLVFLVKRLSRGTTARDPFLKVLASTPVGTNRSVHIISVGSQAWLVGSAEHGVSLISEIQDQDTLNAMLLEDSRRSAENADGLAKRLPDFKSLLQRLGMPAAADSPPGPENISKRRERLKGL